MTVLVRAQYLQLLFLPAFLLVLLVNMKLLRAIIIFSRDAFTAYSYRLFCSATRSSCFITLSAQLACTGSPACQWYALL